MHACCRLVESLSPGPNLRHIDVAGGTGDVAFRVWRALRDAQQQQQQQQPPDPAAGHVTVCDINLEMLQVGKERAISQGEHFATADKLQWWVWLNCKTSMVCQGLHNGSSLLNDGLQPLRNVLSEVGLRSLPPRTSWSMGRCTIGDLSLSDSSIAPCLRLLKCSRSVVGYLLTGASRYGENIS